MKIGALRDRWRKARDRRLRLKSELLGQGSTLEQVRRNRLFRDLRKEQRRCSVQIKHLGKTLNRMRSIHREREQ